MLLCALVGGSLALVCPAAPATATAGGGESSPGISFTTNIAPVLVAKCLTCHGPEKSKGRYRLDTFERLGQAGASGTRPILPAQAQASPLYQLLTSSDPDERMPQKEPPLPGHVLDQVRLWIQQGARFDGPDPNAALVSYAFLPSHPDPLPSYPQPVPILALAFRPDGQELAASGFHEVTVWDPAQGKLLRRLTHLAERTQSIAYHPDGRLLAVAGGSPGLLGEVRLLRPDNGELVRLLIRTPDMVLKAVFNPDGTRLAVGGTDNLIRVFNVTNGIEERRIEQHADWILDLAFAPSGPWLISASRDRSARVFNLETGQMEEAYLDHGQAVTAVAIAPSGDRVFSAGLDRKVHLWERLHAKRLSVVPELEGLILRLCVDGDSLWSAAEDHTLRQHRLEGSQTLQRAYAGHRDAVYALAVHGPTHRLASGSHDGEVRIWNAAEGSLVSSFLAVVQ